MQKKIVGLVGIIVILACTTGYALIQVQHQTALLREQGEIQTTTIVGALGVKCYQWTEGETLGAEKTTHDWGMVLIGEAKSYFSESLVIKNTGDALFKLTFGNDLATNLGLTPMWQIEVCVHSWINGREYVWATINDDGTFTYFWSDAWQTRTLLNLQPSVSLGFQSALGIETLIDVEPDNIKSYGHLRMVLEATVDPTVGEYTYTTYIHATEV